MSGQNPQCGAVSSALGLSAPRPGNQARFADRRDAGRRMVTKLRAVGVERPVVVGIARGGVAVASEVAHALGAPLDAVAVRKIRAPGCPNYALGAVAEGGASVICSKSTRRALGIGPDQLEQSMAQAYSELEHDLDGYRSEHPPISVEGRTVLLVDDGVATGLSAETAAKSLRVRGASRLILAAPVGPMQLKRRLQASFDEVIYAEGSSAEFAIEWWYRDLPVISAEEVSELLANRSSPSLSEQTKHLPAAWTGRSRRRWADDNTVLRHGLGRNR